MENDVFMAGVRPGGPTSHNEIKLLICHVLSSLDVPMRFDQLHEALQEGSLVNYFELVQAVDGLVATGHLAVDSGTPPERYTVTDTGRHVNGEFQGTLPLSIRERAVQCADRLLRRQRRQSEVCVEAREADGGYYLDLSIPEGEGNLIALTVFLPTKEECAQVRRRFLNDPVFLYKSVLALLTGEREVLGELLPRKEDLF